MSHHANLLVGRRVWALGEIPPAYQKESPDVSMLVYERMSIADVRTLIQSATLMPVAASHRVFVIQIDSILVEAQNALLKLFEEPNATTIFYIIVPSEAMLLPTLKSRLNILAHEERKNEMETFQEFLQLPYARRLNCIAEKLKDEDVVWVDTLVRGLESYAQEKRDVHLIKDALMLVSYINLSGSSKKMLLEHIALTL